MKQFKHIFILLFFAGVFSSCNDWLNQTPFDKVSGEELYTTESGAQEALNGLYLGLLNRSLYGTELTVGALEVLAEHYMIPDKHRYKDMVDGAYSNDGPKGCFASAWKGMYKLIAECNVFLEQIELNKDNYRADHYKLYRGEALALRTFLHFDLFRLFAPAWSEENASKSTIPYYDRETDVPVPYLTAEEIKIKLLADVNEAIALLANDPVLGLGKMAFGGATFWDYRCLRLNVYAAWALKARMCLHLGDKPAAYQIAASLLDGITPEGGANNFNTAFPSIMSLDAIYRDLGIFSEVIFGMHDISRENVYRQNFSLDLQAETILLAGEKWRTAIFDGHVTDLRYRSFGDASEKSENLPLLSVLKFQKKSTVAADKYPYRYELLPLIRKGELYLIAAESTEDAALKEQWLERLVTTRGGWQLGDVTGDLNDFLDKEYNRELYGEGQYFFYLKRNARTSILKQDATKKTVNAGYFVFPVPDEETNNRGN